jgi:hypothetical protein
VRCRHDPVGSTVEEEDRQGMRASARMANDREAIYPSASATMDVIGVERSPVAQLQIGLDHRVHGAGPSVGRALGAVDVLDRLAVD